MINWSTSQPVCISLRFRFIVRFQWFPISFSFLLKFCSFLWFIPVWNKTIFWVQLNHKIFIIQLNKLISFSILPHWFLLVLNVFIVSFTNHCRDKRFVHLFMLSSFFMFNRMSEHIQFNKKLFIEIFQFTGWLSVWVTFCATIKRAQMKNKLIAEVEKQLNQVANW